MYELVNKMKHIFPVKFDAKDIAPNTFQDLMSNASSRLVVWSGASDLTIYGEASSNHLFRAWHDSLHIKLNADFSLQGEIIVAREQARLIDSDAMAKIIMAEVQGQAEYFNKHGSFPIDQVAFIQDYLKAA